MRGQKGSYKVPHGGMRGPAEPVVSDRAAVHKKQSAAEFRRNVQRTKGANLQELGASVQAGGMRGGWRL